MDDTDTLNPEDPYTEVAYWGYTNAIEHLLRKVGQKAPSLDVIKTISSKLFTCRGELLLHSKNDLTNIPYEKPLLKSLHGFSGRGHCAHPNRFLSFCEKEWALGLPVICEPLRSRVYDFSTQWLIEEDGSINHLGTLHLTNGRFGSFRSVSTKLPQEFPLTESRKLVEKVRDLKFFGNLGIDAYITEDGEVHVCEVNPRKTLGYVALQIARKRGCAITLSFGKTGNTELPPIARAKQMTVIEHI